MKTEQFNLSDSFIITADMETTAQTIADDIKSLRGINNASVDVSNNSITVDYNENEVSSMGIRDELRNLNFLD